MNLLYDFNTLSVCLFLLFFCIQTFRHGHFQWLWFSVCLWLGLGWLSSMVMPRVLGVTHLFNLYPAHFYVFAGSIFFWLNSVSALPADPQRPDGRLWQAKSGALLTLFAQAQLVQHLAFAVVCILVWVQFPKGLSAYLPAELAILYLLSPLVWHGFTLLLMTVFFVHRRLIMRQSATIFSLRQLYAGLLLALWLQFTYISGINWRALLYWLLVR